MIPKKIHYCWFGKNPLPELAKTCIASWKKFCPDYEIIEWNEDNFDVSCCDYVKEAYAAKKWAFVSDYARFQILYEHGGLYFDTDVEIIKPLDKLIEKGPFMGTENIMAVNPGLGLAASAGLPIYRVLLDAYHKRHFVKDDGTYNLLTVVDYTTEILKQHGLTKDNAIQLVGGVYVYPKQYFCPMDYISGKVTITDKTYTIHHYSASWHSEKEQYAFLLQRRLSCILPKRIAAVLGMGIATVKYEGMRQCLHWIFKNRK